MRWEVLTGIIASVGGLIAGGYKGAQWWATWWGERRKRKVDAIDKFEQVLGRFAERVDGELGEADSKLATADTKSKRDDVTIAELRAELAALRSIASGLLDFSDELVRELREANTDAVRVAKWSSRADVYRSTLNPQHLG